MFQINIFTPIYHRFEFTRNSIDSIIKHLDSSVYKCNLIIGVNGYENDEMKTWLRKKIKHNVKLYENPENIGKAKIINEMYKMNSNCTHVISIDSDLVVDEEKNFIDGMLWCIEHFTEFGLLSTFQKENDQHLWNMLKEEQTLNEQIVGHGSFNSVAGGCVILKKETWDKIKGYSEYGGVYGFDDGLMMQSVKNLSLKTGVIKTVRLTHPFELDSGYKNWKSTNIAKRLQKGYYESC